jgi:hypothetical protein
MAPEHGLTKVLADLVLKRVDGLGKLAVLLNRIAGDLIRVGEALSRRGLSLIFRINLAVLIDALGIRHALFLQVIALAPEIARLLLGQVASVPVHRRPVAQVAPGSTIGCHP